MNQANDTSVLSDLAVDTNPSAAASTGRTRARWPVVVPIRSLGNNHRIRIASHLLGLDPQDRYLRFGHAASDEQIQRYVDGLDMDRDELFGIFNRRLDLVAMAHLAYPPDITSQSMVEFGVSVVKSARGRGFGARLFERASMHARNDGISNMLIHALSENTPMLRIARAAGAVVTREGPESEARLRLPHPTLDTRITEIVQEQMAQVDYHMKEQAHQFRTLLASFQPASPASGPSSPSSHD